jgi:hypothetical protein
MQSRNNSRRRPEWPCWAHRNLHRNIHLSSKLRILNAWPPVLICSSSATIAAVAQQHALPVVGSKPSSAKRAANYLTSSHRFSQTHVLEGMQSSCRDRCKFAAPRMSPLGTLETPSDDRYTAAFAGKADHRFLHRLPLWFSGTGGSGRAVAGLACSQPLGPVSTSRWRPGRSA